MFLNTIVLKKELKNLILNEPISTCHSLRKKTTSYFTFELHNACIPEDPAYS